MEEEKESDVVHPTVASSAPQAKKFEASNVSDNDS